MAITDRQPVPVYRTGLQFWRFGSDRKAYGCLDCRQNCPTLPGLVRHMWLAHPRWHDFLAARRLIMRGPVFHTHEERNRQRSATQRARWAEGKAEPRQKPIYQTAAG